MKVLIVEDETFAQLELKRLLSNCRTDIEVIDCIDSVEEAAERIPTEAVDLIFMDIQLSDGLSFEIFNKIQVTTPVIFTTAYDEYAIRAFKVNSIDYLLKPIEQDALKAALLKYENLRLQFGQNTVAQPVLSLQPQQIEQLLNLNQNQYKNRFMVSIGDKIRHVPTEQIAYFFAEDDAVCLLTADRKKYLLNYTLDQLENMLDPQQFFRINRTYIAAISAIGDTHKHFNSRLKVSLIPPTDEEIFISRARVPHFLQWLGQ
jgi:two-component system response regulator LytT